MDSKSTDKRSEEVRSNAEFRSTRRAVLAAGGVVGLGGLTGCLHDDALDGLLDRGAEQLVGTTVSAPAAFYAGQAPTTDQDSDDDGLSDDVGVFFYVAGDEDFLRSRVVPATVRAEGQEVELEGWSTTTTTRAQNHNSSRSNRTQGAWWAGPEDDSDDNDDGDTIVTIQKVELDLLAHVAKAADAVDIRDRDEATTALDAFIDTTTKARENGGRTDLWDAEALEEGAQSARNAVEDGEWEAAASELAAIDARLLQDIERLDDELEGRRPGRPKFSDFIAYMRDDPTIGERFTVCLPDANLRGDRGSLAEELTPGRVLAYFAPSREPDGVRAPFNDRYGSQGISYDDESCVQIDGPISLHRDISCQNIISAELDTYRTANRGIVGYSTDGGAVVSGAPASADEGGKDVFVHQNAITRNPERLDSWGRERTAGDVSVGETLVCPVAVTPEDSPTPLPGLFYVRRVIHDDQVIFAGGWILDEGALFEDSVTLLFDEGPTEVASVTPEDIESDDYDDRIVGQFSRGRSQHGSAVISGDLDAVLESGTVGSVPKAQLSEKLDSVRNPGDDGDSIRATVTALDAPLVHLAGAKELSTETKEDVGLLLRGIDKKDIPR